MWQGSNTSKDSTTSKLGLHSNYMQLSPSCQADSCATTKKLSTFYGTRRLITVFLSLARSIQSIEEEILTHLGIETGFICCPSHSLVTILFMVYLTTIVGNDDS
jgi:hypothetical protein